MRRKRVITDKTNFNHTDVTKENWNIPTPTGDYRRLAYDSQKQKALNLRINLGNMQQETRPCVWIEEPSFGRRVVILRRRDGRSFDFMTRNLIWDVIDDTVNAFSLIE